MRDQISQTRTGNLRSNTLRHRRKPLKGNVVEEPPATKRDKALMPSALATRAGFLTFLKWKCSPLGHQHHVLCWWPFFLQKKISKVANINKHSVSTTCTQNAHAVETKTQVVLTINYLDSQLLIISFSSISLKAFLYFAPDCPFTLFSHSTQVL